MRILIPMAGEGKRFRDEGYDISKPAIPTYDRRTGERLPMVVCATRDLPSVMDDGSNVIYVDRDFHASDGTEDAIRECFPGCTFITIDHLTEGQACTCLLARDLIDDDEDLLIAGCDNGMVIDNKRFERKKKEADVLVFTYRHDRSVMRNPDAYGWMVTDGTDRIVDLSIKKAISDDPMEDHAVVATFWFRSGRIFIEAAERMIEKNDRINGEFYVDEVIRHVMELGYRADVFEIDRYIGWGTPADYEEWQETFRYWKGFMEREGKRLPWLK